MRVLIIALALLPSLATVADAKRRSYGQSTNPADHRPLTAREASADYGGCAKVRRLGLAPLRRGQPGYRPWFDGDDDGLACEAPRR